MARRTREQQQQARRFSHAVGVVARAPLELLQTGTRVVCVCEDLHFGVSCLLIRSAPRRMPFHDDPFLKQVQSWDQELREQRTARRGSIPSGKPKAPPGPCTESSEGAIRGETDTDPRPQP